MNMANEKRRLDGRTVLAVTVILLLVFGLGVQYQAYLSGVKPDVAEAADLVAVEDFTAACGEGELIVKVSGEVARQGYFKLTVDCSLRDILDYVGLKAESDISDFDLTHAPAHGDEYYIRSKANPLDITPWLANGASAAADGASAALVNLNEASIDELMELPNIGEVKAGKIIEYRKKHGGFKRKEDLLGVDGIGQKTYEQLVDKVDI